MEFQKSALLGFFILLVICSAIVAQNLWVDNGLPIRQGEYPNWERTIAKATDDEILVTWSDCRNSVRSVYVQKYDTNGNQIWQQGDVELSVDYVKWSEPTTIVDVSNDEFVICWEEYNYGELLYRLKAQKITSDGTILWEDGGIICAGNDVTRNNVQMIADSTGGVYIVWQEGFGNDWDIYAQHILYDGSVAYGWNPDGNCIIDDSEMNSLNEFKNVCLGINNSLIVVWYIFSGHLHPLYGQMLSYEGELLWPDSGMIVCDVDSQKNCISIETDGVGGAFVVWSDGRFSNYEIYINHLLSDGSLVCDPEGFQLSTDLIHDINPRIISNGNGGAYIVWGKTYTLFPIICDLYAQRIDSNCTPTWSTPGVAICVQPDHQGDHWIDLNSIDGINIVWVDTRNSGGALQYADIFSQALDSHGNTLWQENGIPVCVNSATQALPITIPLEQGEIAYIWHDNRDQCDLYMQRVDYEGNFILEENGVQIQKGILGNAEYMKMASLANDRYISVWQDWRNGETEAYFQIFDNEGNFYLPENGIPVASDATMRIYSNACSTSGGEAVIAWVNYFEGNFRIKAQKIDVEGQLLWGADGLNITDYDEDEIKSILLCDDQDEGTYIAWCQDINQQYSDKNIYLQRLNASGSSIWSSQPVHLYPSELSQQLQAMITDSGGDVIIAWTELIELPITCYNLYLSKVSTQGVVLWTIEFGQGDPISDNLSLIPSAEGSSIIAWTAEGESGYDNIFAQKVDSEGNLLWESPYVQVANENWHQNHPTAVENEDESIFIIYQREKPQQVDKIKLQKLSSQGEKLFAPNGIFVVSSIYDHKEPEAISDGNGGLIIGWIDKRNFYKDIYAKHVNSEGQIADPIWNSGGNPVREYFDTNAYNLTVIEDGEGGAIFGWKDFRASAPTGMNFASDIYIQRINDFSANIDSPNPDYAPKTMKLYPPHPNPFNQSTVVGYRLTVTSVVNLSVYDITGREVARLVDGMIPAGSHNVTFDGSNLASGVYLVSLRAGDFIQTQKIVLMK